MQAELNVPLTPRLGRAHIALFEYQKWLSYPTRHDLNYVPKTSQNLVGLCFFTPRLTLAARSLSLILPLLNQAFRNGTEEHGS